MTAPRPPRAPRGRIVIVGNSAEPKTSRGRKVVHADSLYDAIGEVTVAPASEPVAAVLVPAAAVGESAGTVIAAF